MRNDVEDGLIVRSESRCSLANERNPSLRRFALSLSMVLAGDPRAKSFPNELRDVRFRD